jgi:hypothetical protein
MQLHIIHLPQRNDRLKLLKVELQGQNIIDYRIWEGIVDKNIPAKGISQAHKQIVRYAKENQLPEVLIAEDDLKFTAKGAFNFFLKTKPNDFDLYLASIYFGKIKSDNTVDDFSGLTFYVVKEKFYDILLSRPEHDNLDRMMKNTGKFIVCNPFTVIQQNGFSDNVSSLCNYDSFLLGRELFDPRDF